MRMMKVPGNYGPVYLNPEHIAAVIPSDGDACSVFSVGVPTYTLVRLPAEAVVDAATRSPNTMGLPT